VLVVEGTSVRSQWPLGWVVKIFTDKHSVAMTAVWWSMRATLKKLFLAFFKKKQKKTFQKQKQFYFHFQNTFVSQIFSE